MVVGLVRGDAQVGRAELVLCAIVKRRLECVPEGRCLLIEEVERLQGEVDRPVEDQSGDSVSVGGGIGLGYLGAVALPVEDDLLVAERVPKNLEVLDDLIGPQIGEHLRIAHFCNTIVGERRGGRCELLLVEAESCGGVDPVVGPGRLRAAEPT